MESWTRQHGVLSPSYASDATKPMAANALKRVTLPFVKLWPKATSRPLAVPTHVFFLLSLSATETTNP